MISYEIIYIHCLFNYYEYMFLNSMTTKHPSNGPPHSLASPQSPWPSPRGTAFESNGGRHRTDLSGILKRSFLKSGIPMRSPVVTIWLVVEPYPSEKSWSSSVGIMTFLIYMGKNIAMFQTNQPWLFQEVMV